MRASNKLIQLFAAALFAAPLAAQAPARPAAAEAAAAEAPDVYRREVFTYQRGGRPDPFQPLLTSADLGFRFEDLRLTSVVYSPNPRMALAVFTDADTVRRYRLRPGQRLGNVTVLRIYPQRVDVRVDEFGSTRLETIQLRRAERSAAPAAVPEAANNLPVQPGPAAPPAERQRPAPLRRGAQPQQQAAPQQGAQSRTSAPVRAARSVEGTVRSTYGSRPRD